MSNTQYDGHLHLVRVQEHEAVVRTIPTMVYAKRIDMAIGFADQLAAPFAKVPPAPGQRQCLREDVVVQESRVDRECAHEEDDVTPTVHIDQNEYQDSSKKRAY